MHSDSAYRVVEDIKRLCVMMRIMWISVLRSENVIMTDVERVERNCT